jgi:hypothetical protein
VEKKKKKMRQKWKTGGPPSAVRPALPGRQVVLVKVEIIVGTLP